ncbi:hypothetical protein G6M86_06600 [Agrobacterium tumefaciens]|uniref:Uncharacterized protein n=1 Tax=Agrobacterium tumefaciens TaxID=358 RepID=A0AAJ4T9G3_AGRTU|nr:hypothetical protein G6M86_06600 [Agrobacterium tumefaciens]
MTFSAMDEIEKSFDNLEKDIYLTFLAAPKHLRGAFTGVNQRRRRSDRMTEELALFMAGRICHTYLFYRGEDLVDEGAIAQFLNRMLVSVPDAEAKACGAKSADDYEPARQQLAARLFAEMAVQWRSKYSPKHRR